MAEPLAPAAGGVTRRGPRQAWEELSLRRRLVLGLLALVTVTLAACTGATYVLLQRSLTTQLDDGLTSVRDEYLRPGPTDPNDAVRAWQQQGATVYLLTATGAQVLQAAWNEGELPISVSAADVRVLRTVPTSGSGAPVTVQLSTTGNARAVALGGLFTKSQPPQPATLVAVVPVSKISAVTQPFLVIELVAMGVALVLVAAVGSWFIRRSLRPLDRVAATAGQVATLPLGRGDVAIPDRVPGADGHTEVGRVASAVNAMLDHVEDSLRTRQDTEDKLRRFVSDAGHELRTPLAAVRGYAELVRRAGTAHPEQALESSARIESAAARMGLLVEDLLLLASLDEGRPLERDEVDLAVLAADAVEDFRTTKPGHDWVDGRLDPGSIVLGDASRLHQVMTNLLANAAAYSGPGTTVTTSVIRGDGYVRLQVRDDGPGFPDDLLPRATERFARGESSRSRATGGSGLGLAIVRAIVESHGGTVAVGNDAGAVVTVTLPPAPVASAPTAWNPMVTEEVQT